MRLPIVHARREQAAVSRRAHNHFWICYVDLEEHDHDLRSESQQKTMSTSITGPLNQVSCGVKTAACLVFHASNLLCARVCLLTVTACNVQNHVGHFAMCSVQPVNKWAPSAPVSTLQGSAARVADSCILCYSHQLQAITGSCGRGCTCKPEAQQ